MQMHLFKQVILTIDVTMHIWEQQIENIMRENNGTSSSEYTTLSFYLFN